MRAEPLVTTEADFFKTLTESQEEAQKHLHELLAQLSQQNTTFRPTVKITRRREKGRRSDKCP